MNPINFTEKAIVQFKKIISEKDNIDGLRIGIKKTGCSGYEFFVDTVKIANDSDLHFVESQIKFYVDKDILPMIEGTEVDFVQQGFAKKFVYSNPKATSLCGCGESFSV